MRREATDMTELDREGRDALHYAARDNDVDTIRQRLAAGVAVDLAERRDRFTALHFAVDNGAVDAAVALLDAGADIEARANRDVTPLHIAVNRWRQSPDGAIIKLLVDHGADKNAGDMHGWTPLERSKGQFQFPENLRKLLLP
jgi:ankyrin repeat protein